MNPRPFLEDFGPRFLSSRVSRPQDVPPEDPHVLDLALLDMHHGWPNLGHDSLVCAVGEFCRELQSLLESAGMMIRVLSYDVRRAQAIPEPPGGRFTIYVGTGGPGHIDPHLNDGLSQGTQGILENPAWEGPAFRLFDAIASHHEAALLGVCHTFGVLCRWAGVASPVMRTAAKGGKSSGVVESVLTPEALRHPWFSHFAAQLPDGRIFKSLDSRLFDLIPSSRSFTRGMIPLSFEVDRRTRSQGEALTMMEFARNAGENMPRILALNHHPEIRDRCRQRRILESMHARGEVTHDWYEERSRILSEAFEGPESEQAVLIASRYTLLDPLRYHLYKQVRQRAQQLGIATDLPETSALQKSSGLPGRESN